MRKLIAIGFVALAAVGGAFALAQPRPVANVELRIWEDVNDPAVNYISARPAGGSWRTFGTVRLPLDDGVSRSGRYRYGDATVEVPLPDDSGACATPPVANVELRLWEDVNDPAVNYVSARPAGGSWRTFGTVRLPLDDGVSRSGRYRYGDATVEVSLPDGPERASCEQPPVPGGITPTPTPLPAVTATVSPTTTATRVPGESATATETPKATATKEPKESGTKVAGESATETPKATATREPKDEGMGDAEGSPTETPQVTPTREPKDEGMDGAEGSPTETPRETPTREPKDEGMDGAEGGATETPRETPTREPKDEGMSGAEGSATETPRETAPTQGPKDEGMGGSEGSATGTPSPAAKPDDKKPSEG